MSERLLERAGRRRSPATLPGFHAGRAPGNKGLRYPADPPKVEEIIAVMRARDRRARQGVVIVDGRGGSVDAVAGCRARCCRADADFATRYRSAGPPPQIDQDSRSLNGWAALPCGP
jgi:hypothetical protein